jgi:hypothetical protein
VSPFPARRGRSRTVQDRSGLLESADLFIYGSDYPFDAQQTTKVQLSDAQKVHVPTCSAEAQRYNRTLGQTTMVDNSSPSPDTFTPYTYFSFGTCTYTYTTYEFTDSDGNVYDSGPFLTETTCN